MYTGSESVNMMDEWNVISSLTVHDITADDGGDYTCIVRSGTVEMEATATLSVNLYVSGEQVGGLCTANGSIESITCMIEGFPVRYEWQKLEIATVNSSDSSDIDRGSGISIGSGSDGDSGSPCEGVSDIGIITGYSSVSMDRVLEFNPVVFGDEGVYRCVAHSGIEELVSNRTTVTSE